MNAIVNLLLPAVELAIAAVWIVSLCRWDGDKSCNPEDCETCPFPCEEHTNKNRKDKQS